MLIVIYDDIAVIYDIFLSFNIDMTQQIFGGFLKWGYPKSPWLSILKWSSNLDDLGYPEFRKPRSTIYSHLQ